MELSWNEASARILARFEYCAGRVNTEDYPSIERYEEEWWEERYLPIVLRHAGGVALTSRGDVYDALESERDYQDDKFSGRDRSAIDRTLDEFILYIRQYADEACRLTTHGDETEALHFVRKVGALCVGCMERHGAPRREGF